MSSANTRTASDRLALRLRCTYRLCADLAGHRSERRAAAVGVTGPAGYARRAAHLVDLVQQVGRGDSGAFANLYDETSPSVYGMALSMVRSAQLATVLTTEVYTEAGSGPRGTTRASAT